MRKVISVEEIGFLKKITKVQRLLDQIADESRNILFYGAGLHMQYILQCCEMTELSFRICATGANGHEQISGILVEEPSKELFAWADKIIIANFKAREEIRRTLLEFVAEDKIVSLYEREDTMPIYEVEIETDAEKIAYLCTKQEHNPEDKYAMWASPGRAVDYDKNVDRHFFDTVTKHYYLKYVCPGDDVLDVGAGSGRLSLALCQEGANVTAVDVNPEMLSIIEEKKQRIVLGDHIKTVLVSGEKLPFADESFDKIVSCDVMHHFKNWRVFLKEHSRVLRHGGYIVHTMLNDDHLLAVSDKKYIRENWVLNHTLQEGNKENYMATVSKKELEEFCRQNKGMELVEMIPYNFFALSAYTNGILTHEEMLKLGSFYMRSCANETFREVVKRFEREIVASLPGEATAFNLAVLRKV